MRSTIKKGPRTPALKKRVDLASRAESMFSALQSAQIYIRPVSEAVGDEIMRSVGAFDRASSANPPASEGGESGMPETPKQPRPPFSPVDGAQPHPRSNEEAPPNPEPFSREEPGAAA